MRAYTYQFKDEPNNVFKTLYNRQEIEIQVKNALEVHDPTIVLSGSLPNTFNYMYIPDFKRFYYTGEVVKGNNDIYTLQLHCDYGKTWAENIQTSYGIVTRNQQLYNRYLPDESYKTEVRTTTQVKNFPYGFNDSSEFILMTCGDVI